MLGETKCYNGCGRKEWVRFLPGTAPILLIERINPRNPLNDMNINEQEYKNLLTSVVSEFVGIAYDDLTTLERNIYEKLEAHGFLTIVNGTVERPNQLASFAAGVKLWDRVFGK